MSESGCNIDPNPEGRWTAATLVDSAYPPTEGTQRGSSNTASHVRKRYVVTPESPSVSYLEVRLMLSMFVKEVLDEEQRSPTLKNLPIMDRPPTPVSLSSPLLLLTLPASSTVRARGLLSLDKLSHILSSSGQGSGLK